MEHQNATKTENDKVSLNLSHST